MTQLRTSITCVFLLLLLAVDGRAQWLNYPTAGIPRLPDGKPNLSAPAPRGRDGHPDLTGIWDGAWGFGELPHVPPGTVIESAQGPQASLQWFRKDAAPVPMTPWAAAIFREHDRNFGAERPSSRCLPHGIPDAMIPDNFKIVQNAGLTLILYEEFARFRQIFTDGRPHPKEMNPAWLGYSIGKWDGDVFVVDTVGFNDKSWLDDAGHPHSEQLHTTERFRRLNVGQMDVEITFEDSKAYTEPFSITLHHRLMPDTELIEDVCDNERDSRISVGRVAADDVQIEAVVVPENLLRKYAGAYGTTGMSGAYDVYFVNGKLRALGSDLIPVSPMTFRDAYGATVTFVTNPQGDVTQLS